MARPGLPMAASSENVTLNSQPGANATLAGFSFDCVSGPNCFLGSSSRMATGWTAGGGLEYALSNNISVKGEYLYTSLGGGDSIRVVGSETQSGCVSLIVHGRLQQNKL